MALYLLSMLHLLSAASSIASIWLSFAVNFVIDLVGHFSRDGRPVRSWFTHSLLTAPVWGFAVGSTSCLTLDRVLGLPFSESVTVLWSGMGAVIAYGHLLLDSLTGAGVYSITRRIALAHFSYDNVLLNAGFALLGVALAVISVFG